MEMQKLDQRCALKTLNGAPCSEPVKPRVPSIGFLLTCSSLRAKVIGARGHWVLLKHNPGIQAGFVKVVVSRVVCP